MDKPVLVYIDPDAGVPGTAIFEFFKVKREDGMSAYRREQTVEQADILVVSHEKPVPLGYDPNKHKLALAIWVEHVILEEMPIPITKRYDANTKLGTRTPWVPPPSQTIINVTAASKSALMSVAASDDSSSDESDSDSDGESRARPNMHARVKYASSLRKLAPRNVNGLSTLKTIGTSDLARKRRKGDEMDDYESTTRDGISASFPPPRKVAKLTTSSVTTSPYHHSHHDHQHLRHLHPFSSPTANMSIHSKYTDSDSSDEEASFNSTQQQSTLPAHTRPMFSSRTEVSFPVSPTRTTINAATATANATTAATTTSLAMRSSPLDPPDSRRFDDNYDAYDDEHPLVTPSLPTPRSTTSASTAKRTPFTIPAPMSQTNNHLLRKPNSSSTRQFLNSKATASSYNNQHYLNNNHHNHNGSSSSTMDAPAPPRIAPKRTVAAKPTRSAAPREMLSSEDEESQSLQPVAHPDIKVYLSLASSAEKKDWEKSLSHLFRWARSPSEATHLIMCGTSVESRDGVSISVVVAIACGIWVLKPQWLTDTIIHGALPPEAPYEETNIPGCKRARLAHQARREYLLANGMEAEEADDDNDPMLPRLLFSDWAFNVDRAKKAPYYQKMVTIIERAGGILVPDFEADIWITDSHRMVPNIFYSQPTDMLEADQIRLIEEPDLKKRAFKSVHTKRLMNTYALQFEFVRDSILQWEVQDVRHYKNFLKKILAYVPKVGS